MHTRKLLIGLIVAGLFAALFGSSIIPAGAQDTTVYVTLATGQTVPVTVPVGTDPATVSVPTVTTPVVTVGTTPPANTTTTQSTGSTPPASTQQSTAPTPAKPQGGQQQQQSTQVSNAPKPQAQGKTKTLVEKAKTQLTKDRTSQGVPTTANPTLSVALPGPAPIGVPNFFIEKFRIPPFLLPIYQAAGIEYGVRWEVLAAPFTCSHPRSSRCGSAS